MKWTKLHSSQTQIHNYANPTGEYHNILRSPVSFTISNGECFYDTKLCITLVHLEGNYDKSLFVENVNTVYNEHLIIILGLLVSPELY